MATLEIEGRDVEVDDSFLRMSPTEQHKAVEEIAGQLGLSAGGNRQTQPAANPEAKPPAFAGGAAGAAALGAMDAASFSFGDELGASLGATSEYIGSKLFGTPARSRAELLAAMRDQDKRAQESNPGAYLGGQIAGSVGTGAGMARGGLSIGANVLRNGGGLLRTAVGSAADGAIAGGLSGAGGGEDLTGRLTGGVTGGVVGLGVGAAAPYATTIAGAAAKPFIAPIASRLRPEAYARDAIATSVRRSGRSVDDVVRDLESARADGQDMYSVADALGNEGQRRVSTIARSPSDARQGAVQFLDDRQINQGDRLSAAIADGFGAPRTALQTNRALTAARDAEANVRYAAARRGAAPVDVSGAVGVADNLLNPGASRIASTADNIADDTVERAVRNARARITDGRSNLSDYEAVFRARQDLEDDIAEAIGKGRGNQARLLGQMSRELDAALSRASPGYRDANAAYARQSGVIDAIDMGAEATRPTMRAADTIDQYNALTPDQQGTFRVGYADRLIAPTEGAPVSPYTNKARRLMTGKTGQEMPEFAAPGRGEQLANRIGREQRMFETYNAARGGSKSADNLADQAETATFDPAIVFSAIAGRPGPAVASAVAAALRSAQGLPPSVIQQMAATLLETNPQAARRMLGEAMQKRAANTNVRALGNAILVQMSANSTGR